MQGNDKGQKHWHKIHEGGIFTTYSIMFEILFMKFLEQI